MADAAEVEDASIISLRVRQAKALRSVTLFHSPFRTLYYFACYTTSSIYSGLTWVASHRFTLLVIVPTLLAYAGAKHTGYRRELVLDIEEWVKYVVWWVGLGVLSSIGLGTGMHSGLLFLFPHILKVCLAAETCGHVRFSIRGDTWYSGQAFECGTMEPEEVGFADLFYKVIFTSVLWGIGTAIGEIPPYWLSYSAAVAGQKNTVIQELEMSSLGSSRRSLFQRVVARMEQWMIRFIRTHGFLGILALASYPNAAFDLCGLCCGTFMFPFWQFFGATLIGKGLFKTTGQTLFFVAVFRKRSREAILQWLEAVLPAALPLPGVRLAHSPAHEVHLYINRSIAKYQDKVLHKSAAHAAAGGRWFWERALDPFRSRQALQSWLVGLVPDTLAEVWGGVMLLLMGTFVVSCVNTFAQSYRTQLDEAEVEAAKARRRQQQEQERKQQ